MSWSLRLSRAAAMLIGGAAVVLAGGLPAGASAAALGADTITVNGVDPAR